MTAYEYLNELRQALEVLPDDERANAIRYYEEYFLDAGPENESKVIEELGSPAQVAQNILNEYTDIARAAPRTEPKEEPMQAEHAEVPPKGFQQGSSFVPPKRSPLTNILALCGAVFLGIFLVPLLAGLAATVFGLLVGALALLLGLAVTAGVLLAGLAVLLAGLFIILPFCLMLAGGALCVFSPLSLWRIPASAAVTFGVGLCLLAVGGLLAIGGFRLCTAAFRPLMRAAGWCIEQCGTLLRWCAAQGKRFLRWCGDVLRRLTDWLKGV